MLISHISDLHLGYAQFGLEEREEDVYQCFGEAIDVSIKEGARLVILAGDLFHTPKPSGKAVITLGNALKKLRERQIPAVFILGEHDISRTRDVPFAYLFSNLGLAKQLKLGEPFVHEGSVIFGENKARRSDIDSLNVKLQACDKLAAQHEGKKVLVLHQGLTDFNKFAGEMNASDLPAGFDYYAFGHYHDHLERRFDYLGGLLVYPGSLDLTPSEGIKETKKGFIMADLSGSEASTHWIPLQQSRAQFAEKIEYAQLEGEVARVIERAKSIGSGGKKPVARIEISGAGIDSRAIAASLTRLVEHCLHYVWQPVEQGTSAARAYDSMPADLDAELFRLSTEALGSEELARFAVTEILPPAAEGDAKSALDLVWDAHKSGRLKSS